MSDVMDLIPHPSTGEALELSAPTEQLAEWILQIKDLEAAARQARDTLAAEVIRRMDTRAKWSMEAAGVKLSAPSPALKTEWDVDQLRQVLAELRAEGLDEEAADAALELVMTYKPRVAGLNALRKIGGDVAERVDACGRQVEPVRRLTVKPA